MLERAQISILGSNELAREGFKLILDERGFGVKSIAIGDATGVLARLGDNPRHVVIIDTDSESEGLSLCRLIRNALPTIRLVLMCDECSGKLLRKAFAHGVDGMMMKRTSCDLMASILDLIAHGEKIVPSHLIGEIVAMDLGPTITDWVDVKSGSKLSDREIGILRCLIDGDANKIISRRLGIAEPTVKVHLKAILRKLNVMNRTQAAIWAVSKGLDRGAPSIEGMAEGMAPSTALQWPAGNQMFVDNSGRSVFESTKQ